MSNIILARAGSIFKSPHLIPEKLIMKIKDFWIKKSYKKEVYVEKQRDIFQGISLDYDGAQKKLEKLFSDFPELRCDEQSEHSVLFAAISISSAEKIRNILEIGTFDGKNAFLLSELFPNAKIDTVDLKDDDKLFADTYKREDNSIRQKFISSRNELLTRNSNIEFIQENSISLTNTESKSYDLIWVDGAHGYPVVAIDIVNSVRLIKEGGVIACDDVWLRKDESDGMYKSDATFNTLNEFKNVGLLDFELIFKRLGKAYNASPRRRKYIAVAFVKRD